MCSFLPPWHRSDNLETDAECGEYKGVLLRYSAVFLRSCLTGHYKLCQLRTAIPNADSHASGNDGWAVGALAPRSLSVTLEHGIHEH